MIKDHGHFTEYMPEKPSFTPRTLYCRNDEGIDWYTIAHQKPKPTDKYFYMVDESGRIAAHDTDPEMMWPLGHRLIETDFPIEEGWIWDGQTFINPT